MNVLCVRIKEKYPAVCIALSQFDSILPEKLSDDFLTQLAQISGDDAVIKVRSTTRFLQVDLDGIIRSWSHSSPHVVGIRDSFIHNFSGGHMGYKGPVSFSG